MANFGVLFDGKRGEDVRKLLFGVHSLLPWEFQVDRPSSLLPEWRMPSGRLSKNRVGKWYVEEIRGFLLSGFRKVVLAWIDPTAERVVAVLKALEETRLDDCPGSVSAVILFSDEDRKKKVLQGIEKSHLDYPNLDTLFPRVIHILNPSTLWMQNLPQYADIESLALWGLLLGSQEESVRKWRATLWQSENLKRMSNNNPEAPKRLFTQGCAAIFVDKAAIRCKLGRLQELAEVLLGQEVSETGDWTELTRAFIEAHETALDSSHSRSLDKVGRQDPDGFVRNLERRMSGGMDNEGLLRFLRTEGVLSNWGTDLEKDSLGRAQRAWEEALFEGTATSKRVSARKKVNHNLLSTVEEWQQRYQGEQSNLSLRMDDLLEKLHSLLRRQISWRGQWESAARSDKDWFPSPGNVVRISVLILLQVVVFFGWALLFPLTNFGSQIQLAKTRLDLDEYWVDTVLKGTIPSVVESFKMSVADDLLIWSAAWILGFLVILFVGLGFVRNVENRLSLEKKVWLRNRERGPYFEEIMDNLKTFREVSVSFNNTGAKMVLIGRTVRNLRTFEGKLSAIADDLRKLHRVVKSASSEFAGLLSGQDRFCSNLSLPAFIRVKPAPNEQTNVDHSEWEAIMRGGNLLSAQANRFLDETNWSNKLELSMNDVSHNIGSLNESITEKTDPYKLSSFGLECEARRTVAKDPKRFVKMDKARSFVVVTYSWTTRKNLG